MQGISLQDQILKNYIDSVFKKYDKKKVGKLDELQMAYFFNQLFMQLGIQHVVTPKQAREAMRTFDQNGDGLIDKKEMFDAFKFLMTTPPPPPVYHNNNQAYYVNNSQNNFEDKYKNVYSPCSNNQKKSYPGYRNTF